MFFSKKKEKNKNKDINTNTNKNKESFFSKIKNFFTKKKSIKIEDLDEVESILLSADIGVKTTLKIIRNLEKKIKEQEYSVKNNEKNLYKFLKKEIQNIFINIKNECLEEKIKINSRPYVILIVGVNGVGKTTTVGKLAFFLKNKGYSSVIGAADTFRAAAIDQLEIWAKKAKVHLIKQHINADSASVAYDTLESAKSKKIDVAIIDTAGRLHNRINLMEELSKISRVMKKIIIDAPHEVILVLDATTGQNAIEQVKKFFSVLKITSIILTKVEGTAKAGFILSILEKFKIPIKYVGNGEKIEDFKIFNEKKFINSFFK
ncbi:signal recognition particle-docking protein FtsY [Blattabacterium cuenoti]|uniref:signal recognition particle-docking protein FtsY n=1 Tax=Blattabacterium cuenoti TaxID=1653831 RepID=UPI00163C2C83|nr:signal recognition particle-docking protein FtsY [Blattabacterium cuenoti]